VDVEQVDADEQRAGRLDVDVRVVEPGQREAAAEVDRPRSWTGEGADLSH
jgi:hypothetical protein